MNNSRLFSLLLWPALCFVPVMQAGAQAPGDAATPEEMMEKAMQRYNDKGVTFEADETGGENWDARINSLQGNVFVKCLGKGKDAKWLKAERNFPLENNDKVRTDMGATAEISFSDGGLLNLGQNSELKIGSLDQTNTKLTLSSGSLVAKLKKFTDKAFRFAVNTPEAVAAIRGTELGIERKADEGESVIGVFDEGRVSVSAENGNAQPSGEIILEKNQETFIRRGMAQLKAKRLQHMLQYRLRVQQLRARLGTLKAQYQRMRQDKREEIRSRFNNTRSQFNQKLQDMHNETRRSRDKILGRQSPDENQ